MENMKDFSCIKFTTVGGFILFNLNSDIKFNLCPVLIKRGLEVHSSIVKATGHRWKLQTILL